MLIEKDIDHRHQFLTAKQAAARLGIKVETLYAYVSRGLIERSKESGAHESRFLIADIETLKIKRSFGKGSNGISLMLNSKTTEIVEGMLLYRGANAGELASTSSFESVADFLWSNTTGIPSKWLVSEIDLAIADRGDSFLPRSAPPLAGC